MIVCDACKQEGGVMRTALIHEKYPLPGEPMASDHSELDTKQSFHFDLCLDCRTQLSIRCTEWLLLPRSQKPPPPSPPPPTPPPKPSPSRSDPAVSIVASQEMPDAESAKAVQAFVAMLKKKNE